MILVICAVSAELRDFTRGGVDVVAVGVGPVEAALGTGKALAAKRYELVVNAGIGGAFAGRAEVGEAVAATIEHYVELGREDGSALTLSGELEIPTTCQPDAAYLAHYRAAIPNLRCGPALTSATITSTTARAHDLAARYAPIMESMEGFAVLRAATLAGVGALEIRGMSNIVGDRASSGWDFRAGAAAAVAALEALLDVVQHV